MSEGFGDTEEHEIEHTHEASLQEASAAEKYLKFKLETHAPSHACSSMHQSLHEDPSRIDYSSHMTVRAWMQAQCIRHSAHMTVWTCMWMGGQALHTEAQC